MKSCLLAYYLDFNRVLLAPLMLELNTNFRGVFNMMATI